VAGREKFDEDFLIRDTKKGIPFEDALSDTLAPLAIASQFGTGACTYHQEPHQTDQNQRNIPVKSLRAKSLSRGLRTIQGVDTTT